MQNWEHVFVSRLARLVILCNAHFTLTAHLISLPYLSVRVFYLFFPDFGAAFFSMATFADVLLTFIGFGLSCVG